MQYRVKDHCVLSSSVVMVSHNTDLMSILVPSGQ